MVTLAARCSMGTPTLNVAVAGGPEFEVRVALNGEPAKKPETGKVSPPCACQGPGRIQRTDRRLAVVDCVRVAVAVTVAEEVDDVVPVKVPVSGANRLP